jgi:hypothetical protein
MLPSTLKLLNAAVSIASLMGASTALPQATASPSPTPSAELIPWSTKIASFRAYIASLPDTTAKQGFFNGPALQQSFSDGNCLQIRFYNWDCFHDIVYKTAGVLKYLDSTGAANLPEDTTMTNGTRYYQEDYYVDPDDEWNFYGVTHLTFGGCGNRGPQSACGVIWCVDKDGNNLGYTPGAVIPEGQCPYIDPNNRNQLCPWLGGNETSRAGCAAAR